MSTTIDNVKYNGTVLSTIICNGDVIFYKSRFSYSVDNASALCTIELSIPAPADISITICSKGSFIPLMMSETHVFEKGFSCMTFKMLQTGTIEYIKSNDSKYIISGGIIYHYGIVVNSKTATF
jgi:hypothetical protein